MMRKDTNTELTFKAKLGKGKPLLGTFVKAFSLEIIEIIGMSGFDFIIIDMEHTTLTFDKVEQMVRAADLHGMHSIIRIPDGEATTILHALDLGATGIQVPQIDQPADVEAIVRRAKYPPEGTRGVTYAHRAAKFGFASGKSYMEDANCKTTVVVHIETEVAFNHVQEICKVEGCDVVFIGSVDLSIALGTSADYLDGDLAGPVQTILEACGRNGKHAGIVANSEKEFCFALEHDIAYVVWGSDIAIFKQAVLGVKHLLGQIQQNFEKKNE